MSKSKPRGKASKKLVHGQTGRATIDHAPRPVTSLAMLRMYATALSYSSALGRCSTMSGVSIELAEEGAVVEAAEAGADFVQMRDCFRQEFYILGMAGADVGAEFGDEFLDDRAIVVVSLGGANQVGGIEMSGKALSINRLH